MGYLVVVLYVAASVCGYVEVAERQTGGCGDASECVQYVRWQRGICGGGGGTVCSCLFVWVCGVGAGGGTDRWVCEVVAVALAVVVGRLWRLRHLS